MDEVLKAYPQDVKFVFKHFPLPMHPNAANASRAALAAGKQGKFWEMHDKIFQNQRTLDLDNLKKYAGELGLDAAKFEADLAAPDVKQQIDEDVKLGQASGVRGTPSLYLNGKMVTDRSVDGLKRMVDAALKAKGS